jgi:flagellar basal body-associated protein FliL
MAMSTASGPTRVATTTGSGKGGKGGKGGDGADGAAAAAGGKSKLKLIVVAVLMLVVAGAAAKFLLLAPAKSTGPKAAPKPEAGPVMPLDDMTLNLQDNHFLRVSIGLVTIKGSKAIVDTSEAKQAIVDEYSNKSVVDLTGLKARDRARQELVKQLGKAYPMQIMDVYYTGFVMQ